MHTTIRLASLAAAGLALALGATPADGQILNRIRDRVSDRVRQGVEETVDRTVDRTVEKAAETVEGGVRDAAAGATQPAAGATQPAAGATQPAAGVTQPAAGTASGSGAPSANPAPAPASPASAPAAPASASSGQTASANGPAGRDSVPVRPARRDALATPFTDADLAWMLPLLNAQAADARRLRTGTEAAVAAWSDAMSSANGAARVEGIRSGRVDPLGELRVLSTQAAVPPSARYERGCSAGVTGVTGGLVLAAVYTGSSVDEARAFYRNAGWDWTGQWDMGYQARSPDGRLLLTMNDPRDFGPAAVVKLGRDAREGRAPGYESYIPCADLSGGVMTMTVHNGASMGGEAGVRADNASAAASQSSSDRLPGALRQAGLLAEEWDRVVEMIYEAATDDMYAHDAAQLDTVAGSRREGDRRRANVGWYARNRAVIDGAVQATTPQW